jgi:Tfp pilus assembly protein PilV
MSDARGLSLVEILVATCVLSVGLVAVATGLLYATTSVDAGRGETTATFLAEQRLELLKSLALTDWSSPLLAAGATREGYGTLAGAPLYRRDTTIADWGGAACATAAPGAVTCKTVRVAVYYRVSSGGGGTRQERRVELLTVMAFRT